MASTGIVSTPGMFTATAWPAALCAAHHFLPIRPLISHPCAVKFLTLVYFLLSPVAQLLAALHPELVAPCCWGCSMEVAWHRHGVSPVLAQEAANLFTLAHKEYFWLLFFVYYCYLFLFVCFGFLFVCWLVGWFVLKACKLSRFRRVFVMDNKVHFPQKRQFFSVQVPGWKSLGCQNMLSFSRHFVLYEMSQSDCCDQNLATKLSLADTHVGHGQSMLNNWASVWQEGCHSHISLCCEAACTLSVNVEVSKGSCAGGWVASSGVKVFVLFAFRESSEILTLMAFPGLNIQSYFYFTYDVSSGDSERLVVFLRLYLQLGFYHTGFFLPYLSVEVS